MTRTPAVPLPKAFVAQPLAHRGLHDIARGLPENTRAAVRAAVEASYGIEIDVQPSADGQAMVFHDEDLDRLTGEAGDTSARTAADLSRLRVLGSNETIPTLPEILAIVGGRVPLLVEIKDQHGALGPVAGQLEAAVANALQSYPGPVAVMSFNPHSVAAMARLAPDIPRGLTTAAYDAVDWPEVPAARRARLRDIADYADVGASFISHEAADLGSPRVAALKAEGAVVLCWTIRSPGAEATARTVAQNITFEGYMPALPRS